MLVALGSFSLPRLHPESRKSRKSAHARINNHVLRPKYYTRCVYFHVSTLCALPLQLWTANGAGADWQRTASFSEPSCRIYAPTLSFSASRLVTPHSYDRNTSKILEFELTSSQKSSRIYPEKSALEIISLQL